jgi:hypothetical protein
MSLTYVNSIDISKFYMMTDTFLVYFDNALSIADIT